MHKNKIILLTTISFLMIFIFSVSQSFAAFCGGSDKQYFSSSPSSDLCSVGQASLVTTNSTTYNWTCSDWKSIQLTGGGSFWGSAISSTGQYQLLLPNGGQIYRSIDYGNTWAAVGSSRTWMYNSADMSPSGQYQIVASSNRVLNSSDYGATWTERLNAPDANTFNGVAISSTGQYQTVVHINGYIYTSSDYGVNWTQRASVFKWHGVDMSSTGQYQTATVLSGQIYRSVDYGNTWAAVGDSRLWIGISLSSDGQYQTASVSYGYIYTSSDYGVNWTQRASSKVWNDVSISSTGQYQVAVLDDNFTDSAYFSSDYGVTWTAKGPNVAMTVSISPDGNYILSGNSGYAIFSDNYYSGNTVSCFAYINLDGICGSANGQSFGTIAPINNLCSVGTASLVSNNGTTYDWTCSGISSDPVWTNWAKRKQITVYNPNTSNLTNYQVKVVVSYDSDMQADFDDIRFTGIDGTTELNYWLESKTDSSTATFWVKIPSLINGSNTIYMYYGNPSAASTSNGDNTFIFFDDFLGSQVDTNKWSFTKGSLGNGNYSVASSVLTWTKIPFGIRATHASLNSGTLMMRTYLSNPTGSGSGIIWATPTTNSFSMWGDTNDYVRMYNSSASTWHDVANFPTSYSIIDLKKSNNSLSIYINGAKQGSSYSNTYSLDTLDLGNAGYSSSVTTTANFRIDWLAIREAADSEPTVSFSSETQNSFYCSAIREESIVICGQANEIIYSDPPADDLLCAGGTPSLLSGSNPWSWTCIGDTTISCSTRRQPCCGSSDGQSFSIAPTENLCAYGNNSDVTGSGPWNWTCQTIITDESWYNSLWTKRKAVTINNNSGSEITNYQVKLTVAYDSDMQNDFDDIRFTLGDGTTWLNHWLESKTDSSTATFWVKIPTLSTGNNTIYMYYGNNSATSASNGKNTFDFFDGFVSLDTNVWEAITGSHFSVSDGILTVTSSSGTEDNSLGSKTKDVKNNSTIVRAKLKVSVFNGSGGELYFGAYLGADNNDAQYSHRYSDHRKYINSNNTYLAENIVGISSNTWFIQELIRKNAAVWTVNGGDTKTVSSGFVSSDMAIWFRSQYYTSIYSIYCDWVLVRKYVVTEPTVSFEEEEAIIQSEESVNCSASVLEEKPSATNLKSPLNINANPSCWYCNQYLESGSIVLGKGENLEFKFNYTDSDSEAKITSYQFAIGTDSDVNNALIITSQIPVTPQSPNSEITYSNLSVKRNAAPQYLDQIPYNTTYNWWIKVYNDKGKSSDWIQAPSTFTTPLRAFPLVRIVPKKKNLAIGQSTILCSTISEANVSDDCYTTCWPSYQTQPTPNLSDLVNWKCSVCYDSSNTPIYCSKENTIPNSFTWSLVSGTGNLSALDAENPTLTATNIDTPFKSRLIITGSECGGEGGEVEGSMPLPKWKEISL